MKLFSSTFPQAKPAVVEWNFLNYACKNFTLTNKSKYEYPIYW